MSTPQPFCWNCLAPASQRKLKDAGSGNHICVSCEREIDALITHGKDWAHVNDAAREAQG